MLRVRAVLQFDVRRGHTHQLIKGPELLQRRFGNAGVAVAVKQPHPTVDEIVRVVDHPLCVCTNGLPLQAGGHGRVWECPARLLEVAAAKMGADSERGDNPARNKRENEGISERRRDVVNLSGAAERPPSNDPGPLHQTGEGNMELVGEERSRRYARYRYAGLIELGKGSERLDRNILVVSDTRAGRADKHRPDSSGPF